jgi:hypothetical protein
MTLRLATLVKRVAELHDGSLQACHCTEEFTLRRIHPLGHRDMIAYDPPLKRMVSPNQDYYRVPLLK